VKPVGGGSEENVPTADALYVCPVVGVLNPVAVGLTPKLGDMPEKPQEPASTETPVKSRKSENMTIPVGLPEDWVLRKEPPVPFTFSDSVAPELAGVAFTPKVPPNSVLPAKAPLATVYMKLPVQGSFEYFKDKDKTEDNRREGFFTVGDIGYLDEDGYLFLCDRKDFMIIRGGVNIYPQAIENVLIEHPKVADAAVIGVPSAEFGEEVKAVIQLKDPADATHETARDILAFCRAQVSDVSRPRTVDFVDELPRLPTGKLAKHEVRRKYWADAAPVAAVRS